MKARSKRTLSLIMFLILLLVGAVFIVWYLITYGNTPQVYNDIVLEWTAIHGSNKAIEKTLLYLLIGGGLIVLAVVYLLGRMVRSRIGGVVNSSGHSRENDVDDSSANMTDGGFGSSDDMLGANSSVSIDLAGKISILVLLTFFVTNLLLTSKFSGVLLGILVVCIIAFVCDRSIVPLSFVSVTELMYAGIGMFHLLNQVGFTYTNALIPIQIGAISITLVALLLPRREMVLRRICLISQPFILGTLFVYKIEDYHYGDEIIHIATNRRVLLVIYALLAVLLCEAILRIIRNWTSSSSFSFISLGAMISIMNYNRFAYGGAMMSGDMHHPFENIIGFSQIFELGQTPFSEYIPVSGLYSVVQGAFFKFFGSGLYQNYYITDNLFYLAIIVCIALVLRKTVSPYFAYFVSTIYILSEYNRSAFILLILVVLISPKLRKNNNLWLLVYALSSLFHGLYYPIFGAAICIGFLPLALYKVVMIFRSGEWKTLFRKVSFWLGWGVALLILLASIPLLVGTLRHTLAMSDQTILADGLSRFGQYAGDSFFPYLENQQVIRQVLLYVLTFLPLAAIVWIGFIFATSIRTTGAENRFEGKDVETTLLLLLLCIVPPVIYTYSIVRLDVGDLLSRSFTPLAALLIAILIICVQNKSARHLIYSIAVLIGVFFAMNSTLGLLHLNDNLVSSYTVMTGDVYVEDNYTFRLGTGFINEGVLGYYQNAKNGFGDDDASTSYLGGAYDFGVYYTSNVKGDGTIEALTIKGYSATEEAIEILRENHSAVYPVDTYTNYYLYHWLMTSGEYVWNEERGRFEPNDEGLDYESVVALNQNSLTAIEGRDLVGCPDSLGSSMETLMEIFDTVDVAYSVASEDTSYRLELNENLYGEDADYLYLEFETDPEDVASVTYNYATAIEQENASDLLQKLTHTVNSPDQYVTVTYLDEDQNTHTLNAKMGDGKLLISLGSGNRWLLDSHMELYINVKKNDILIEIPSIKDVKFLKLREVS